MRHLFSLLVFFAVVVNQFAFGLEHKLAFSAQQTAAIEKIIDEHLVNHPELLMKMLLPVLISTPPSPMVMPLPVFTERLRSPD